MGNRQLVRSCTALCAVLTTSAAAQEALLPFDAATVATHDRSRIERLLDLDGDGDLDAIGWWPYSSYYSVVYVQGWINNGNGRLQLAFEDWTNVDRAWTTIRNETVVANWDGDGLDDFVIGTGHELLTFRSAGGSDPIPGDSWLLPNDEYVESVATADFDGDGFDDLLVASENLRFYRNDGGASAFTLLSERFVGSPTIELRVGDVDGDLAPDVIVAQEGALRLFPVVNGVVQTEVTLPHDLTGAPHLTFGDVDGDGDEDVVLFAATHYQLFRRNGPAQLDAEPKRLGGPATDLADIDGDGLLDGVCCGGGSSSPVYNTSPSMFELALNVGNGDFAPAFRITGLGAKHIAGAADLDGDGDADLVAGRAVYYGRGPIDGAPGEALPEGALDPRGTFDVDLDGDVDLHVGLESTLANLSDGQFTPMVMQAPEAPVGTRFVGPGFPGDFDGDGDPDLIVRHETNQGELVSMRLLCNESGGVFTDVGAAGVAGKDFDIDGLADYLPERSRAIDLDQDGDLDLVTLRHEPVVPCGTSSCHALDSKLWWNDGAGFFVEGELVRHVLVHGALDWDGDGHLDLFGVREQTWKILVAFANGDGTYAEPALVGPHWWTVRPTSPVLFDDFDQDGAMDFAFAYYDEKLTVIHPDGAGGYTSEFPFDDFELDGYPDGVRLAAADLNGDGWTDFVGGPVDREEGSSVAAMQDPGGGGWSPPVQQLLGLRIAADVDGNGAADLLDDGVLHRSTWLDPGYGSYCVAASNSASADGCRISAGGSPSVSANTFTLVATGCVPGQMGKFWYGPEQVELPFGDGVRCVGAGGVGTFRLYPPEPSSQAGTAARLVDFTAPPASSGPGMILPGATWYFQYWYRDPQGPGGSGFNVSDGLGVRFTP